MTLLFSCEKYASGLAPPKSLNIIIGNVVVNDLVSRSTIQIHTGTEHKHPAEGGIFLSTYFSRRHFFKTSFQHPKKR